MLRYPENPILFEYRRGGETESVHRGAFALVVGERSADSKGEIEHPYFLRSAAKPFQALPLVESGAAEKFGLNDEEIALVTASHNGEDAHEETARSILKKGGLQESDLRCGAHPPFDAETAGRLRAEGKKAGALRHNCSGKHAGMLLLAKFLGQSAASYLDPEGPAQKKIRAALGEICGCPEDTLLRATDGCSAPTFALPLRNLALGYARLANPAPLRPALRAACERIVEAVAAHPYLLAGRKQLDTDLVQASGGRIFAKRGAEGIYALGVRGANAGLALKIDDGANRCHPLLLISLLKKHKLLRDGELKKLSFHLETAQKNYAGLVVGETVSLLS